MASNYENPFQFEAATSLQEADLIDYFVQEYNFSNIFLTKKDVIIQGERGSGKTMMLLFFSLAVQMLKEQRDNVGHDLSFVGFYVPCNTPLYHKEEHMLLPDTLAQQAVSEHLFVCDIAQHMIQTIIHSTKRIPIIPEDLERARKEFQYVMDVDLADGDFLDSLNLFFQRESSNAQKALAARQAFEYPLNFASVAMTLMSSLRKIRHLENSHFMFLLDDIYYLNEHQKRLVNSLISYRDSPFSIKASTFANKVVDLRTNNGLPLIEGHDYTGIDLEEERYSKGSNYYNLSKKIVEKRISKVCDQFGLPPISAEAFFPPNNRLTKDLEKCRLEARKLAIEKYGESNTKAISDYIQKYAMAIYFRERPSKSNAPPYSGFSHIVDLSTGLLRNMLEPCFRMYEKAIPGSQGFVDKISAKIQREVILDMSKRLWRTFDRLPYTISNCTKEDSEKLCNLFTQLCNLFTRRLHSKCSEPRAISFFVSGNKNITEKQLKPLFQIALEARLLYSREINNKDGGRTILYTPNRMLLPIRQLDFTGQTQHLSLKNTDLLAAADGIPMPFFLEEDSNNKQETLPGISE